MYICVCHGVTESQIRRAADDGCRDMHELIMRTGCGSGCGGCLPLAAEVLADASKAKALPLRVLRAA
jgi:bacterioferritin-associated ferredoxin